ncbi:MAG: tRNA1(Val) (adenine(37)-N6)-methyltransferase [Aerococcus sp.]|nr:tRNA1(Val) (adenine(37)-N6)-methyltransferase [Aerococcus sp.]
MTNESTTERIDYLPGQALQIIQSDDTFALSTDTMFLGHFTHVRAPQNQRVLDFCTGTGALPLLLSTKTAGQIEGIELQPKLADMATRSVALNGLSDQIHIRTGNITEAKNWYPINSIDVITCNPPYFKRYPHSTLNPNSQKALARHEVAMTLADVFDQAKVLLRDKGKLCLVHRPERLSEMQQLAQQYGFSLKRLGLIYPRAGAEANTILVEFMKHGKDNGLKILPPIIVYDENNHYTKQTQAIFYGENDA